MKTLYLSIMISAASITVISILLFLSTNSSESKTMEGTLCESTMKIIYAEPSKYDKTMILNALQNNLSKDDFGDVYGTDFWWKYVSISSIDENGTVTLAIPSANEQTINMTEKIVSKIDGISRILPAITTWCT